ncbi:hypothetical protein DSO57_1019517 [Entomophthora muscae]|uniref:Uncharacterized protein n=1 Tax=Entomophthora muscae TaxID=34485 RepID=A0ACC2UDB7_9FUNG|nr:hypothetical protein DSO57_1019517 [Entomophthora muscae]
MLEKVKPVLDTSYKPYVSDGNQEEDKEPEFFRTDKGQLVVVNNSIHHVLILPFLGHFEDKSLAFAFDSQNKLASASGNMIVWFPDSAQLTCPTHACGE